VYARVRTIVETILVPKRAKGKIEMTDQEFWAMIENGIYPRAIWMFRPRHDAAARHGESLGLKCGDLVIIKGWAKAAYLYTQDTDSDTQMVGVKRLERPVDKIKVAHAMQATFADFIIQPEELEEHFCKSDVTEYDQDRVTVTFRVRMIGGWGRFEEVEMTVAQARAKRNEYAGRTYETTAPGDRIFLGISGTMAQQIASGAKFPEMAL